MNGIIQQRERVRLYENMVAVVRADVDYALRVLTKIERDLSIEREILNTMEEYIDENGLPIIN